MPDLPADYRRRYSGLGLPAADVLVLADELPTAHYFDDVLAAGAAAKPAANWIMGDIMAFCKVIKLSLPLLGLASTQVVLKANLSCKLNWNDRSLRIQRPGDRHMHRILVACHLQ